MKLTSMIQYIILLSCVFGATVIYGQGNWQLYDDFSSATIDTTKWNVNDRSAAISLDEGRVKFEHQSGNAGISSNLEILDLPETVKGIKATLEVESCSGDVRSRVNGFVGTSGSNYAFSEHAIRIDKTAVSGSVVTIGPPPDYTFQNEYFYGEQYLSSVIGTPYTLSLVFSSSSARFLIEGKAELEYSYPFTLASVPEGRGFIGIGTRSNSGTGICTVYFDDVYIMRETFNWSAIIPVISANVNKSE